MLYLLHGLLALTVFLLVLNSFLRGGYKAGINAFLIAVFVALLVMASIAFHWQTGVVALLMSALYAAVSRPLAARLAAKVLFTGSDGSTRRYVGLPPRALRRISRKVGPNPKWDTTQIMLWKRSDAALEALMDYCDSQPDVRKVMTEFGLTKAMLIELFKKLEMAGAGQWAGEHYVPASALAYQHTLRYLLESHRSDADLSASTAAHLVMHFESGAPLK